MKFRASFLFSLSLLLALPVLAQDYADGDETEAPAEDTFLSAFLADFEGSSDKLVQLAGAFSDEQYSWRPAEGIRSVSEMFVHVANANIRISLALGFEHEGMERPSMQEAEQMIISKADVIADLTMSQAHVRGAIKLLMDQDLSEGMPMFGQTMSRYQVLMILGGHSHEHLGQAIAYARSVGVTPPWSEGN